MARNINRKLLLSDGAKASIAEDVLSISGAKGELSLNVHDTVKVSLEEDSILFNPKDLENKISVSMTSTMRSLALNMIEGVTKGFEKKLELQGVGYRAQVQGQKLKLSLGFSHDVDFSVPEGIKVECPSQTEITVSGIDKQKVGQVAAEIRSYRPPEPYKGKGVRYVGEYIFRKEGKKK